MQPTDRQQAILDHLRAHIAAQGRPPTLAEVAAAFGIHLNAVRKHLHALAGKGLLELTPGTARGIRLPDTGARASRHILDLPLVGRVAAGSPIMSEGNVEARFVIDAALFRPRADYLLRVQGQSMCEAGIGDGDLIAVRRTPEARDGQIVVARIEDEITVKRLRVEARRIVLLPANPAFTPIIVDARAGSFAIEGVHVGTIRRA
ncbi:MAG: transcriptional repressor LexA [Proteobacteria bacterium]|nr:transcriptional repressor LexA [Pseudomonadota bacterium]